MPRIKYSHKKIRLIGKKIVLRGIRNSDTKSIQCYAKNREISKYTDLPHPFSLKDVQNLINQIKRDIKKRGGYQLGIELQVTGEIIGIIGLTSIDKHKKAEIEYWIGKKYWGQGITKEAIKLILDFGFKKLKLNRIYAKAIPKNIASWKLLEKCGFSYEGKLRESLFEKRKFVDLLVYSILKREYKSFKGRFRKYK